MMPRATGARTAPRRPLAVRPGRPRRRALGNHRVRILVGRLLMVAALLATGVRLVQVQGFEAAALSTRAEQQRATPKDIPAQRGSIVDRNGTALAFSVEARALWVLPRLMKKTWTEQAQKDPHSDDFATHTAKIAAFVHQVLGDAVNEQQLLTTLRSDTSFAYLDEDVDPAKADQITQKYPDVGSEYRAIREYPQGPVASNIVGAANWRMDQKPPGTHGLSGLESSMDGLLAGKPGSMVVDTEQGNNDVVIPGTERDLVPATPGSGVQLTIDSDTQYAVQQMLSDYVAKSGAKDGSMVVLDAHTGEVYALANDKSFDPNHLQGVSQDELGDAAVTTPYEPGSVNKVVTAAAAIEYGVVKPDTVIPVPGELRVADRTIHDAWVHGTTDMTFTGVLAKSSNIGTILTAQKVGPDRYADMLNRFGLGQKTGIGLPGESPGFVPARNQWSGSTFGNLPIGQGLSMTVLQMAGMYQAIANDGVRVPPRIIKAEIKPDGTRQEMPQPAGVRVVSPDTAKTVRDMLRAVTQSAPRNQSGTGPSAALPGYQISGKTGTAQQIDPRCGCYSNSQYWITFAGILPADNPRFVVGIMLDAPDYYGNPLGRTAAPLFHDVADYLAQRFQIPVSATPSPVVPLTLP